MPIMTDRWRFPCLLAGPWLASVATVVFKARVGEEEYGWLPFWLSALILAAFVTCGACWFATAQYRFRWLMFALLVLVVECGSGLAVKWLFALPSWRLSQWIGAFPAMVFAWGIAVPILLLVAKRPSLAAFTASIVIWVLLALVVRLVNSEATIWWLLFASIPIPTVLGTRALAEGSSERHGAACSGSRP